MKQSPAIRKRLLIGLFLGVALMLPAVAQSQSTTNVDVNSQGAGANQLSLSPAISADGRYVAFSSVATNLVSGDHNELEDVFVHDRQTKMTTRVSVNMEGGDPNDSSQRPSVSGDGRFIAFHSSATNLIEGDMNNSSDIFVFDRETETTSRVSVNTEGGDPDSHSIFPAISGNGRFVSFWSVATNLVPDDTNEVTDIFVYDRQTETTTRVSVNTEGGDADKDSRFFSSLNGDGRYVAFQSSATNLVPEDTNGLIDIFVYDQQTATTSRVSVTPDGGNADGNSQQPALSTDGRYVAFESDATNLVAGETSAGTNIYVYDRQTQTTERVSVNTAGLDPNGPNFHAGLSANGRFVSFRSSATDVVRDDTNGFQDIVIHDRETKTTTLVSVNNRGEAANDASQEPVLSGDGRFVAFVSGATNLVGNGEELVGTVFVRDRANPDRTDVDGDEIADIVWRNQITGATGIWLMEPQNPLTSFPREMTFPGVVGLEWQIQGVGDVTDDQHADLVWHNTENGATAVWVMNEEGEREAATFPGGAGLDWSIRGLGDVNNDGHADFVWRNTENGATAVWLMNQEGEREAATFPGGAELAWSIRGVADVNRDGTADWVWRNKNTGATAVWLMNQEGEREEATFPGGAGGEWKIEGVDDFTGDGHADLVWRNQDTGNTAVWVMNAAGLREEALFPPAVALDFTIPQLGDFTGDGRADSVLRKMDSDVTFIQSVILDEEGLKQGVSGQPGPPPEWEVQP